MCVCVHIHTCVYASLFVYFGFFSSLTLSYLRTSLQLGITSANVSPIISLNISSLKIPIMHKLEYLILCQRSGIFLFLFFLFILIGLFNHCLFNITDFFLNYAESTHEFIEDLHFYTLFWFLYFLLDFFLMVSILWLELSLWGSLFY